MRTVSIVFIVIISLAVCVSSLERRCNKNSDVNGCSIPCDPKIFYEKTFTPACDHHDVCFYCHVTYNKTRRYCDILFLDYMVDSCQEGDKLCSIAAIFYYISVRLFGGLFWNAYETPFEWCVNDWVESCIENPF